MNQLAKQEPPKNLSLKAEITSDYTASQLKTVLPAHITVEKFQRVVLTALIKNNDLAKANKTEVLTACIECAQDGLLPNGKEAALVMYGKKVQYMPMIAGIYKRARNSGEIATLNAQVVYEDDVFDFQYGFEPSITHRPNLESGSKKVKAVYAVAVMKDGTRDLEVMSEAQVKEIQDVSKASYAGNPWQKWWGEMAKKTVMRRLVKRLPVSSDVERIVSRVDDMYPAIDAPIADAPPIPQRSDFVDVESLPEAEQFAMVDEDGVETLHDADDFRDALHSFMDRTTHLDTLEGVWKTNAPERERYKEAHPDDAEALVTAVMARRGELET